MALVQSVNDAVKDRIGKSNPDVQEAVIAGLVKQETDRRTKALTDAITKVNSLSKDLLKLKPDVITYPKDGGDKSENYSAKVFEDRQKLTQRIEKLEKAIEKAAGGDFGDLYNIDLSKD